MGGNKMIFSPCEKGTCEFYHVEKAMSGIYFFDGPTTKQVSENVKFLRDVLYTSFHTCLMCKHFNRFDLYLAEKGA